MSASHPLDGDGVSHLLFHYLAKDATMLAKRRGRRDSPPTSARGRSRRRRKRRKADLDTSPEYRIPDTVVFFNTPTTWYYWDEMAQKCEKKDAKELEKDKLESFFGQQTYRNCDICCSFLSRKSGEPDSVIFLNKEELHEFLYSRPEHHGLLQRFIVPQGDNNFMYQAIWCRRGYEVSQGITRVFKRISRQKLKERFVAKNKRGNPAEEGYVAFGPLARHRRMQQHQYEQLTDMRGTDGVYSSMPILNETRPMNAELLKAAELCKELRNEFESSDKHYKKAITFEGAAHYAEERWCHSGISDNIQRACQRLVEHFEAIDHMYTIARMVLYFKEDKEGRLWLMFSSAMRIQEARFKPCVSTDQYRDVYRFGGALTPNFKGLFAHEDDDDRSTRRKRSTAKRPATSMGTFKTLPKWNDAAPSPSSVGLGGTLDAESILNSTAKSPHLMQIETMKAAFESTAEQIATQSQQVTQKIKREIDRYSLENEHLRSVLQGCHDEVSRLMTEHQSGSNNQINDRRICHQNNQIANSGTPIRHCNLKSLSESILLKYRAHHPSRSLQFLAITGVLVVISGACLVALEKSETRKTWSRRTDSVKDGFRFLKATGRTADMVLGVRKKKSINVKQPFLLFNQQRDTQKIFDMILHSHEEQRELRLYDKRLFSKEDFGGRGQWGEHPIEYPYKQLLLESAGPSDDFDDLLYNVYSDVAYKARGKDGANSNPAGIPGRGLEDISLCSRFDDILQEVVSSFPGDYIFDIPSEIVVILLPKFQHRLSQMRIRLLNPIQEFRRVLEKEQDRNLRDSRCPGIKQAELDSMNDRLAYLTNKFENLCNLHESTIHTQIYRPGYPATFIIRQGERPSVPEFNKLMTAFRDEMIRPVRQTHEDMKENLIRGIANSDLWRLITSRRT